MRINIGTDYLLIDPLSMSKEESFNKRGMESNHWSTRHDGKQIYSSQMSTASFVFLCQSKLQLPRSSVAIRITEVSLISFSVPAVKISLCWSDPSSLIERPTVIFKLVQTAKSLEALVHQRRTT